MNTFLAICLYAFAVCAALGLIPPALLAAVSDAARERKPALAVLALLIAAFVIFVLVSSAVMLHG